MKQMKTYNKSDFHNPEQLTRQQVGAEYRLLLNDEDSSDANFMSTGETWTEAGYSTLHLSQVSKISFRVPLATPLPDGTVLSSNECCFSETIARPRIYCAGPMSSHPDDFNFPDFFKASEELEKQGYEAINPAQMDCDCGYTLEKLKQLSPAEHQEFLKDAVKRDLAALQTCQAIAMLPGWENSKGAKAELAVAQWLGLDEVYLDGAKEPAENIDDMNESKQPDADGWITHVPGDPMPCDGNLEIEVKLRGGRDGEGFAYIGDWGKVKDADELEIVAWRPAQPNQPYNSDERAEWKEDARYAHEGLFVKKDIRGHLISSDYAPDDPKGAAGAKKAPMWLLPASAMRETAWVHKHGADKYGPFNWREGSVCSSTYISAIMRHLDLWRDGEDNDAESGRSHLASIAASCNILMDAMQCGTLRDDRNKLK